MTNHNHAAPMMDIHDAKRRDALARDEESRRAEGAATLEFIRCHACKNRNSAAQKFCTKCGQLLWEPCVVCETLGPVGQVYCGSCGSHLDTARRNKAAQFEKMLAEAEQLRGESRFREAGAILKEIAASSFSCAAKEIQRAKQHLKTCEAERLKTAEIAETLTARAEELVAKAEYREAAGILLRIPPAARSETAASLLQMAQDSYEEIERLCGEVESSMSSRMTADVPRKVGRILELRPGHEKAGRWAKKLRQQLFAGAQVKIKQFRFDKAEELLQMIPRAEFDREAASLLATTADLADMDRDIRKSPVVDDCLPKIAELFARRVPGHPQAAAWLKTMTSRWESAAKASQQGLPRWIAPPQQTWLGTPVDGPTGFRKIEVDPSCGELACLRQSGRFYTACGLALQGISQAWLNLDLLPVPDNAMLRQVSRLRISRNRNLAWGLDLGSSGLKAVKLSWDARRQMAKMEECYLLEFPKNLQDFVDEGEKSALIQSALRDFREKHPAENETVAVSLPGRLVLYRVLEFPPMDTKKLASAVQFEARRAFPFPLDQLVWRYQPLNDNTRDATAGKVEKRSILLAAAKRSIVAEQLATLRQAGLRADILQSDSLALVNHFGFEAQLSAEAGKGVALFDIGSCASSFIVCSLGCVWSHGVGFGANRITQCLMREFGLTGADAESLKRRPQTAESFRRWNEAVRPAFESVAQEIHWSSDMFARAYPGVHIESILGTGGGFMSHGLVRFLQYGFP